MPIPKPNESQADYIARCIPIVIDEGTVEDQDQAVAVCNSMWKESKKEISPHGRLLQMVRSRTEKQTEFGYGILTADRYVKRFLDEIGIQACYRHMCRTAGTWASFEDVMQKAAGTLSYINPGMEIKAKGEDDLPSTIERPKNTLMVFRHVLTTSTKDRDGDILRTSGAKPDPRMLLLWQHVHTLPIGKMLAVAGHTKDELQLYSCIIDMNDLCHDAAVMVDNGMGRFSHGFRALNFLEIKEGRDSAGGFDVKEFEILEESLVSVPANPDAETEEVLLSLVEGGKLTSPLMKDYGQAVRLHRPIRIPVQFDVKVSVDNQEVKSHAIEPRDEKREGERPGTGPSEKAEAVVDEGWEEEKSTENDEVKAKADEKPSSDGFGKVECPECGEDVVPDEDGECPECGATVEEEKPEEEKRLIDELDDEKGASPGHPFYGNQWGGGGGGGAHMAPSTGSEGAGSGGSGGSGSGKEVLSAVESAIGAKFNMATARTVGKRTSYVKAVGVSGAKAQQEVVDKIGKSLGGLGFKQVAGRTKKETIWSSKNQEQVVRAQKRPRDVLVECIVNNKQIRGEEKSTEDDEMKAKADEKPSSDGLGKVECLECEAVVVPDEDGKCPKCGATIEEEKPEEEKQLIDDPASGGTLAVPPKQGYGKEDKKMVCPECDYTGPGKEGKCPKCGAKLTPSKDFILEKLGRVLSKANEGKIRDAIDDLEEASKMDGIPRGCKALVVQAKRSLGNVVDSLGTDSGVEKSELKMDAKQALAILLASGGEDERKLLSSVLKAIEDGIRDDETTKQYSELLASN